jgi:hypothetical protein
MMALLPRYSHKTDVPPPYEISPFLIKGNNYRHIFYIGIAEHAWHEFRKEKHIQPRSIYKCVEEKMNFPMKK